MHIAIAGSSAGKYHKAGLPNIKGTFNASQLTDGSDSASGALIVGGGVSRPTPDSASDDSQNGFSFDASKSNVIYGRSSTVQPESNEWMRCRGRPSDEPRFCGYGRCFDDCCAGASGRFAGASGR